MSDDFLHFRTVDVGCLDDFGVAVLVEGLDVLLDWGGLGDHLVLGMLMLGVVLRVHGSFFEGVQRAQGGFTVSGARY